MLQDVMIDTMPDIEEMLTVRQAQELAQELGDSVSRSAITQAARRWAEDGVESGIRGAKKLGQGTSIWLVPRDSFLSWLENHRRWGK